MSRNCLIGLVALSASGLVVAEAQPVPLAWEVGVSLGQASHAHRRASTLAQFPSVPATATLSDTDTGYKIFTAYRMDEFLSLEVAVVDLGDVLAEDGATLTNLYGVMGLSAEVTGRMPLSRRITAFGGFGFFVWDASRPNHTTVDSGTEMTWGLGLDINVYGGAERRLRVEWERYDFDSTLLERADFLSVGLLFAF